MDSAKRNGAGYYDPTAFQAIKNTEKGAKRMPLRKQGGSLCIMQI